MRHLRLATQVTGWHVPVCAPHWVQNKNNVSVAISVNYELRSVERLKRIYRINHRVAATRDRASTTR